MRFKMHVNIPKQADEEKEALRIKNMMTDLNTQLNKLLKAKIGPSERDELISNLPFIIKGLYDDGYSDQAKLLEKKLAKWARNLRLPLEPLELPEVTMENTEDTTESIEDTSKKDEEPVGE